MPLDKLLDQPGQVPCAVSQWRDADGEDVETIEKIRPEAAVFDALLQIGVGGGDQAHVDADGFG